MSKKNISYVGEKVSIGIDVHRDFFVISAVYKGALLKRSRIASTGEAVLGFIRGHFPETEIQSCYEAGFSGFWLHRYLVKSGIDNIVVNPASIEVEANNRIKTDKRDSLKMALQLDANRLRGICIPSEEQERRRLLHRTREQLMRAQNRARIQIRMKLHQFGLFPRGLRSVLTSQLAKDLIEGVQITELRIVLEALYSQWQNLRLELRKLEKELLRQGEEDEFDPIYRSVVGIGVLIARVLSNELGDMSQFANEKELFSYTGLTPCEYSSGESIRRGHITRQGNSRLRYVLVEAAWRAIRKDVGLRAGFERIAKRRGKKIAIVAVARKLVGRIRAVLKARGRYELEHNKAA
ncbi:MAG: IS110 family transposase [SAR324 cluster bacterium]|uniref:IS110 family transposase n=1 Tax=SAR324 cluster bacterium TaxID=2024889 RepID=A0A7X9FTF1_9DELT|nr:IS110 family transposase [SAR324 cluster bacterium]